MVMMFFVCGHTLQCRGLAVFAFDICRANYKGKTF